MCSSTSFVIQIANLFIEICGFNDEDSACLGGLKRVFHHHEVICETEIVHRIVVCPPRQFELPNDAVLQWVAPCLGVAGLVPRRMSFFSRIFSRNREIPLYSGTCNVNCYRDSLHHVEYFIPEYGKWRVEHYPEEHITYAYSDQGSEMSDGLPSMLINVIGSQYGCYLIFASCVAVDGEALLFTGNSGEGKSTLCMELVKQGAAYIGDDLVLLYMDGEQAMVGSLLFPLKYYADKGQVHKKKMDMVSLLPQRPPLNVPLKSVYLLQRDDTCVAESYLKPLRSGVMIEKLLKRTNKANTNPDARHFVSTLSSVCETVSCYCLSYGDSNTINLSFFGNNDQR